MTSHELLVKKLHPDAIVPTRAKEHDAGLDLFSLCNCVIPSRSRGPVPTGIAVAIAPGRYGRVADKSSVANRCISVCAGVVDSGYRNEVIVLLHNHSNNDILIEKGEAIAQLIIERIDLPSVKQVDELPSSDRGGRGFGIEDVSIDQL
jgi:dUTP pyrophosphatase